MQKWELDSTKPDDYHAVEAQRGREWIIRMTTGADVFLALQQFAKDHNVRFAKIHAAFMGGLQPAKLLMWIPDKNDPGNWHWEAPAVFENLSMVGAMGGVIHPRPGKDGKEEPFPAVHAVIGGAWNVPTVSGHLEKGSIVKGVVECFITEILGIDVLAPSADNRADEYPENWYQEIKK
ncbi:MAG: DNA-binding protein [Coprothermobacterota bacterium]|nr:DNA-binding protein [Coprothermobacterota bacterium]